MRTMPTSGVSVPPLHIARIGIEKLTAAPRTSASSSVCRACRPWLTNHPIHLALSRSARGGQLHGGARGQCTEPSACVTGLPWPGARNLTVLLLPPTGNKTTVAKCWGKSWFDRSFLHSNSLSLFSTRANSRLFRLRFLHGTSLIRNSLGEPFISKRKFHPHWPTKLASLTLQVCSCHLSSFGTVHQPHAPCSLSPIRSTGRRLLSFRTPAVWPQS